MSRRLLSGSVLVLAVLSGSTAWAQLPAWDSTPDTPGTIQLEQSLVVITQGNTVKAFSAITRNWASVTTVFGPPVNSLPNEHLVVRDGPVFWGFSPRNGEFKAKLALDPGAALVPHSTPQTWHSIVLDGNHVHAFFAMLGQWMTYSFPSPPTVTMSMNGRFAFVMQHGPWLYAVSTYSGTLMPCPAMGAAPITPLIGNMALATTPGLIHGFSAPRGTWASFPIADPAPPALVTTGHIQGTVAAIDDGVNPVAFFSGHTGAFVVTPAPPGTPASLDRYSGVLIDGNTAYGYSGLKGTLATATFASPPVIQVKQQHFQFLEEGGSTTAYSPETGSFAAPVPSTGQTIDHRAQIATMTGAGSTIPGAVYSSLTNEWYVGPPIATGQIVMNACAVVCEDSGGGLYGWSFRGPLWHFQPAPILDVTTPGTSPPLLPETFFLRSGTNLYMFNSRLATWSSTTTSAPATLVRAHHQTVLAQDGANAYGYNIWTDEWTTQPLPGGFVQGGGQVTAGWVRDGTNIYVYSGSGQFSAVPEFPNYYRAATLGGYLRLDLVGEAASPALLLLSPAPAHIPTPFGVLHLEPAFMGTLFDVVLPAHGLVEFTMQIPDIPVLSGITVYFQGAVFGPGGLYLTNSAAPTIY